MSLTDNLVSYYKLDGNSTDTVGSYNGTDTDITYSAANGKIVQGAGFNGSSSKIEFGGPTMTGLAGCSLSAWFRFDIDNVVNYPDIYKSKDYVITFGLSTDNHLSAFVKTASGNNSLTSTGLLTKEIWYFATLVYDGSNVILYINGAYNTQTAATGNTASLETYTGKMGLNSDQGTYWNGAIDEVGVWQRALSATEVSQLYNGGNGLPYPLTVNQGNMLLMF